MITPRWNLQLVLVDEGRIFVSPKSFGWVPLIIFLNCFALIISFSLVMKLHMNEAPVEEEAKKVVMSRAARRKLKKGPQKPVTAERKEAAREELRVLRKHLRMVKSNGGRRKVRKLGEKRERDDGEVEVPMDLDMDQPPRKKGRRLEIVSASSSTAKQPPPPGFFSISTSSAAAPAPLPLGPSVPTPFGSLPHMSTGATTLIGAKRRADDSW